jgi:hypothetical protein
MNKAKLERLGQLPRQLNVDRSALQEFDAFFNYVATTNDIEDDSDDEASILLSEEEEDHGGGIVITSSDSSDDDSINSFDSEEHAVYARIEVEMEVGLL